MAIAIIASMDSVIIHSAIAPCSVYTVSRQPYYIISVVLAFFIGNYSYVAYAT